MNNKTEQMEETKYYEEIHGIKPPTWWFVFLSNLTCLGVGVLLGYLLWGVI